MRIVVEREHDARVCVLRVHGEIDSSTAPDLEAALQSAVNRGCINLVIDLAHVSYVDSSALGLIVWLNRILEPLRGRLVLAGASRNVSRILEVSGLVGAAATVSAAPDAGEALAGLMLAEPPEPPLWSRRIEIPARSSSLSGMRADVCEMLGPLNIAEQTEFDIRVAVGEALSNAIRHGSPGGEGDVVSIVVTAHPDRVVLVVSDGGAGFDGQLARDGDPYASSGRGVMFMRALMDHVDFVRLPEGGTAVTLVKHLGNRARSA